MRGGRLGGAVDGAWKLHFPPERSRKRREGGPETISSLSSPLARLTSHSLRRPPGGDLVAGSGGGGIEGGKNFFCAAMLSWLVLGRGVLKRAGRRGDGDRMDGQMGDARAHRRGQQCLLDTDPILSPTSSITVYREQKYVAVLGAIVVYMYGNNSHWHIISPV